MKKIYTLIFCMFFLSLQSFAQEIIVTGVVTSSEDKMEIPGVAVRVVSSNTGTVTGLDGDYSVAANPNDSLEFSFVGMRKITLAINNRHVINVVMEPDAQVLNDVVVTALGIKRQKRELGYATEDINGELLARSGSDNIISALSGRAAGVQIINADGVAGGSSRIVIRGNNSIFGDNQPLIVVDGVPMTNEGGVTDWSGGQDWGTALNNINQEDIEDINILKGPTAAALYGSRGGNGVMLITTKKGKKKEGLGLDFSTTYKLTTPYGYRNVQNKYGYGGPVSFSTPTLYQNPDGQYEFHDTYSSDNGPAGEPTNTTFGYYGGAVSWGPVMDGTEMTWWDGSLRNYAPQPDNLSMLYHNSSSMVNSLSFQNAGDFGSVRVSATNERSDAIIDNCKLNQTTVNFGSMMNVSEKVKAEIAFSYVDYYRLNTPTLGESYSNFNKGLLYSWPRSWQGLESQQYEQEDGTQTVWENYPYKYMYQTTFWDFYNHNIELNRDKFFGSAKLIIEPTDWLMLSGKVAMDFTHDRFETKNKPTLSDGMTSGMYKQDMGPDRTIDADFLVTAYKDNIFHSQWNIRGSFGGERYYRNKYTMWAKTGTWAYPNLYTFYNYINTTAQSSMLPEESRYEKQVNSLYGFLNVSYAKWLFLDITGRNDWSSTLPSDNNSYFYPSATLSFVATEAFKINWGIISFMKLRGSAAMTASDDLPYQLDFTYNTGSFGGQLMSSLPGQVPPLQLKPQRQRSFEIGLEMGFWDKVNLDFTYYDIYSWDQILSAPVAPSSGSSSVRINTGVVTNKGIELILNYNIFQRANSYMQVGLNLARNTNRIVSLGGADMYVLSEVWGSNGPAIAVKEGDVYGTIYGWDYVYETTAADGTQIGPFYDEDGNALPLLNSTGTEYMKTTNRVPVGNSAPVVTGGVNLTYNWKGLQVYALIDAKFGGDIYCGSYVIAMQTGQSLETMAEREGNGLPLYDADGTFLGNYGVILPGVAVNTETGEAEVNDQVVHYYYKYMPNFGGWGNYLTTPGIVKNTWVKLRELTVSYTLPKKWIEKTKFFQNVSVSVTGRDLFYFYKNLPDNINPEGTLGTGNAQGLEYGSYPMTRAFLFSLKFGI
ncbi:MAG: SusC/RagA family TonB-linked outer membrane protein [Bacteroidales bacterium]|nr:SusC/RagA family TonB-linked outer membrane protein [Bacteroidales bacterium]